MATSGKQEQGLLSSAQLAALHEVYDRHGRVGEDGSSELDFQEFSALAADLQLPVARRSEAERQMVFEEVAKRTLPLDTVSFEDFCAWVADSKDVDAVTLEVYSRQQDASFTAGLVRVASLAVLQAAFAFKVKALAMLKPFLLASKQVFVIAKAKASLALKSSMKNPTKLFKRQVLNPLEDFKKHPSGAAQGLKAEFLASGARGIASKAYAPYLANTFVAMSMFHSYSSTRMFLHRRAAFDHRIADAPLSCEAAAGAAAGIVQATLHTPLYNVRLARHTAVDKKRVSKDLITEFKELYRHRGLLAFFRNYPFVIVQEVCSLSAFFVSYEWLKTETTIMLRHHVDATGDMDLCAWALAASGAGVVLVAVGSPFENLLMWHVSRRKEGAPQSVLPHFVRFSKSRKKRLQIALSGMRWRLPLAPLAGLPLLAYEVLMHRGIAPVLHDTEN
eukprot:TRINITY_DN28832_c0_g1_i1.p1 TRINITY_DN28832_c0_g1~~TRINITY_DN28832_c0_g1_i1.p1  ORF type:complete len:447 (-),score=111.59 TRINITY_DN28832_c0_g1_i1:22-1362(-)